MNNLDYGYASNALEWSRRMRNSHVADNSHWHYRRRQASLESAERADGYNDGYIIMNSWPPRL